MIEGLLALVLITLSDPSGDARGDGTLLPPTAPVYRSLSAVDLLEVSLLQDDTLGLSITMGSLANPLNLPNGFSIPIIEVYLDTVEGGSEELLAGSGLKMPPGTGWEYALRLTGEGRHLFSSGLTGDITDHKTTQIELIADGQTLIVKTPFTSPKEANIFAIVGLYDSFAQMPWRSLSRDPSPWAFSSQQQRFPVIDVLAEDLSTQQQTLTTGVLPLPNTPAQDSRWFVLMGAGIFLAILGVAARLFSRTSITQAHDGHKPSGDTPTERTPPLSKTGLDSQDTPSEESTEDTDVPSRAEATVACSEDDGEETSIDVSEVTNDPPLAGANDHESAEDHKPTGTSDRSFHQDIDDFSDEIEVLEEESLALSPDPEPPAGKQDVSPADEDWQATWLPDDAREQAVATRSSVLRVERGVDKNPLQPSQRTDVPVHERAADVEEEGKDEGDQQKHPPMEPGLRERARLMIAIDRAESESITAADKKEDENTPRSERETSE
ncbi:MAG: hypothetical protein JSV66_07790 [Trueperaceae bacterium]|nr:MAG: hypothetical protein JSV66_07790 [Trueperaceae bacterium]